MISAILFFFSINVSYYKYEKSNDYNDGKHHKKNYMKKITKFGMGVNKQYYEQNLHDSMID